ncbi:MAG TPA: hypothetical protein VGR07_06695, partial [Thermoanaerobaculia bacterium]|nr:hypothetical protein [Thermoanaerobaculia bacterium]
SRAAVQAFYAHYQPSLTKEFVESWETLAVQVLERVRAVGRMAAQAAVERGDTAIGPEETIRAAGTVATVGDCPFCPPAPAAGAEPWKDGPAVDPELVILGQACVAFGQGTGALRVSREAVAALRERYGAVLTAEVVQQWDGVAVQVLERLRAIGRLAAHLATSAGRTAIGRDDVLRAALAVEVESDTDLCPPRVAPFGPVRQEALAANLLAVT